MKNNQCDSEKIKNKFVFELNKNEKQKKNVKKLLINTYIDVSVKN